MAKRLGEKVWVFPAGNIPVGSTGEEPEFTSREELCLLNTGRRTAHVEITVYFDDRAPAAPYRVSARGRRVCHVRINDLIDPHAIPLGVPYGLVVRSDRRIVAQFARLDTRRGAVSSAVVPGFAPR